MTPFWDDSVAEWVAARIPGCERGWNESRALGVRHKGQTVAGVVFHDWNPEAGIIELSAAATDRRWMTRQIINTALRYAFDGAKCQMTVVRTSPDNMPVRRIWAALGGCEYIIPRLRGRDQSGTIITLTDDAWRRSKFYRS